MYFIAPLLFWADAEMTCGFLIFCVPSIASTKFLLPNKTKNISGPRIKSTSSYAHTNTSSCKRPGQDIDHWSIPGDDDEDSHLQSSELEERESRERLRPGIGTNGVTRTICTTIDSQPRSESLVAHKAPMRESSLWDRRNTSICNAARVN